MLQLIGGRRALDAIEDRYREIILMRFADELAQRAPVGEIL
jgi:hypothetical protein